MLNGRLLTPTKAQQKSNLFPATAFRIFFFLVTSFSFVAKQRKKSDKRTNKEFKKVIPNST